MEAMHKELWVLVCARLDDVARLRFMCTCYAAYACCNDASLPPLPKAPARAGWRDGRGALPTERQPLHLTFDVPEPLFPRELVRWGHHRTDLRLHVDLIKPDQPMLAAYWAEMLCMHVVQGWVEGQRRHGRGASGADDEMRLAQGVVRRCEARLDGMESSITDLRAFKSLMRRRRVGPRRGHRPH